MRGEADRSAELTKNIRRRYRYTENCRYNMQAASRSESRGEIVLFARLSPRSCKHAGHTSTSLAAQFRTNSPLPLRSFVESCTSRKILSRKHYSSFVRTNLNGRITLCVYGCAFVRLLKRPTHVGAKRKLFHERVNEIRDSPRAKEEERERPIRVIVNNGPRQ